jgi:AAA15 family ATPase/GTPase
MLTSLIIRNYRIFKEIKINKLSRVNLFVGKNNTGKSCLLEALQIYASKAEPQILSNIISSRDEKWNTKNDENIFQNSLGYLFNGYTLPLHGIWGSDQAN